MSINPTNPVLGADHKPALGHTRVENGSLEWLDSHTFTWRPAVRQHLIRERLIRQASQLGSYAHQRDGRGTDVTSFLPKDKDFGTAWAHRPPILFQLYGGPDRVSQKPYGVLMDGDRVMLDPYDHPIRDFPELPITLSTKEKGMWIEYYMRQNKEIKPYDLMARMGKDPATGKAMRVYTLNERATKFRNAAACLSWSEKTGSAEKKAYILSLLPPGATDTFSLGGDLTKEQQKQLSASNKGKFPNRRRKAKRESEAQAVTGKVPTHTIQTHAQMVSIQAEASADHLRDPAYLSFSGSPAGHLPILNAPGEVGPVDLLDPNSQYDATQISSQGDAGLTFPNGGELQAARINVPNDSSPGDLSELDGQHGLIEGLPEGDVDFPFPVAAQGQSSYTNPPELCNEIDWSDPALFEEAPESRNRQAESSAAEQVRSGKEDNGVLDHPGHMATRGQKRRRSVPAHDLEDVNGIPDSKRARTSGHIGGTDNSLEPQSSQGGADFPLRIDEDGYTITHYTPDLYNRTDYVDPIIFECYQQDSEHQNAFAEFPAAERTPDDQAFAEQDESLIDPGGVRHSEEREREAMTPPEDETEDNDCPEDTGDDHYTKQLEELFGNDLQAGQDHIFNTESSSAEEGQDAAGCNDHGDDRLEEQIHPHTHGQKRQRSPSTEDAEELNTEYRQAKRSRNDAYVRGSGKAPADFSRGQKRGRDEESSQDSDAGFAAPTAKRQKSDVSSQQTEYSDGAESEQSSINERYSQTSLKTISRPTTSGKGPVRSKTPDYSQTSLKTISRPIIGGKGPATSKAPTRPTTAGKAPFSTYARPTTAGKAPWKDIAWLYTG